MTYWTKHYTEAGQPYYRSESEGLVHHVYRDGSSIVNITEVRGGLCNIYYRILHDGETFEHSGGPTDADRYLEERNCYYGDPPVSRSGKTRFWWLKKILSVLAR